MVGPVRRTTVLAIALAGLFGTAVAFGQTDPAAPPVPAASSPTTAAKPVSPESPTPRDPSVPAGLSSIPTELRYLPNAKGELIPILRDANLDGYLEWLRQQQTNDAVQRPTFSVAAVELEGSSDEELVSLKCLLKIQIAGSDRPVLVPIGLSEAVITREISRGAGRAMYGGKDRDQGYTWWFEGAGAYELEFDLLVPVRKASPWRRMPLTVPLAPVTSLKLRLPLRNAVVRTTGDAVLEATPHEDGQTDVLVAGFGSRLELSWQPAVSVTDQPASLDVNTSILVRGTTGTFLIDATQYVTALQGTFREFVVRLPPKGELLQVDGAEVRETQRDADHPERITVQLNAPTAGPVTVKWQVRLVPADRKRTILEGFSVDGARRQSGDIGLLAPESARWTYSEGNDPQLERMNAGELRPTNHGGQVVRAYRFYGQPFRLPLQLEPVEPYFDMRPTLIVYADEDDIRLDARYDVRTFRGQLTELPFVWPGWRTEGWTLEGFQPQGTVATGYTPDDTDGSGRIVAHIADRAPQSFQLRLIGRLLRRTPDEVRISLPKSESPSSTAPARLLFVHAENVEAELSARGETALRPITGQSPPTSAELGFAAGLQVREYRLESDERMLTVRVAQRPLQVTVDRQVAVSFGSKRLSVKQELNYQIAYDRLPELLVATPADLAASVNFRLGERDVQPDWQPGGKPTERIARIALPEARLGQVTLTAAWDQVLPDDLWNDREATVSIPLLSSTQGPIEQTRVECVRPAWFDVSVAAPEWELQHRDETVTRWRSEAAVDDVTVLISPTTGADGGELIATRAKVRVQLERSGVQHYRYRVTLSGGAPRVNVQLPRGVAGTRFFWGSQPVDERELLELPAGSSRFTVPMPDAADAQVERLLTIDYTLAGGTPPGMSPVLTTKTPHLPQCRWAAQIVWQVHVPTDQHLFSYPATAAPLFEWVRDGVVYRRVSPTDGEARGLPPEDGVAATSARNRYAFSQFGGVQDLQLRLLSSGAALFFGSGCSLLLGFIILKAPWLRSLPALLVLCCAVLTAALWLMPQIELLLQPMLLGLLLVMLLGSLDGWNRRRVAGTVLTLSASPSDFRVADPEAATAAHNLLIGSPDSATVFRAPTSSDGSRPRIAAESQVG